MSLKINLRMGKQGDAESSSPVLSADGRYVAFTSASSNLVDGDTNNNSDVFFRDRTSGSIELISISSAGGNGRSDSGLSFWGRGYYSLNISRNGRYVIFELTASNWVVYLIQVVIILLTMIVIIYMFMTTRQATQNSSPPSTIAYLHFSLRLPPMVGG